MRVQSLNKPVGKTCEHCGTGCAIYETRPEECRGFLCGYLVDPTIDETWKPSRCNFIMVQRRDNNCVVVQVDPKHPDAWKKEPYYSALIRLARRGAAHGGTVYVWVGSTKFTLEPIMP